MFRMICMKKQVNIFTIVAGLILISLLLVSCDKDHAGQKGDGGSEIGFSSSVVTKALVDDVGDIAGDGFRVYGYYTDDNGVTSYPVFDPDGDRVEEGVVVNDEDQDGDWTYSPKRYWIPSAKYAFLGLYPADADVTVPDLKVDNDGKFSHGTPLRFTYTHKRAEDDLMAAKTENITSANSASGVNMPFEHMLSNIRVNLQNSNVSNSIYVKSYTLSGMYASADYAYSYQDGTWVPTPSSERTFEVSRTFDSPLPVDNSSSNSLLGEDGINCIPAANAYGDVNLVLDCLVTIDGVNTQKEFTLNFPEGTWERGKRYTYSATLSADGGTGGEGSGEGSGDGGDIVLTEGCYLLVHQASGKMLTYNSTSENVILVDYKDTEDYSDDFYCHFQIAEGQSAKEEISSGVYSDYKGYIKVCQPVSRPYIHYNSSDDIITMTTLANTDFYFNINSGSSDAGNELNVSLFVKIYWGNIPGFQAAAGDTVPSVGNDKDNTWTFIPVQH